jgi:hypothetical protein
MAISVTCPNGHILKVKDQFAGKSGLCPHCKSRVFVPMPVVATEEARISDDEILGLLGPATKFQPEPPPRSDSVLDEVHVPPKPDSGVSLLGSSILKRQKVCPKCAHVMSITFTNCSKCGTRLPELGRK